MVKKVSIGVASLVVLSLVILSVAWLTPSATAGRLNGSTPFTAQLIEGQQALGTLAPGETEWHQFSLSEPPGRPVNLSLVFTPNQPDQSRYVEFGLHNNEQLEQWYLGNTTALPSLGTSYVVMRDDDPNTGELFLSSQLEAEEVYYIRVTNQTDFTIHYSVFIDVEDVAHKEAIAPVTTVLAEPQSGPSEPAAAAAELPAGIDPNHPVQVAVVPQQVALHEGQLAAQSDEWVELRVVEENGQLRQPLELTLFATPGDGNMVHKLHLDLFPNVYAQQWSVGNGEAVHNFGAGRIVERDGDPLTAELVWNGHFNNDEPVLVRLRNDNPFAVDFYLFTGDIINVELGQPAPAPAPPVRVAPGVDPNHGLPLALGQVQEGDLQPGQERWYTTQIVDFDGESKEHLQLTLYQTPNGGQNVHRVHLEIFNAGDRHIWSRGNTEGMPHFGSGAIVDWDEDEQTGILFWDGWLVDGNEYLIRVRNSAQEPVHYWLFTEAAQDVSLGQIE